MFVLRSEVLTGSSLEYGLTNNIKKKLKVRIVKGDGLIPFPSFCMCPCAELSVSLVVTVEPILPFFLYQVTNSLL